VVHELFYITIYVDTQLLDAWLIITFSKMRASRNRVGDLRMRISNETAIIMLPLLCPPKTWTFYNK
jgi:hypothetical protein